MTSAKYPRGHMEPRVSKTTGNDDWMGVNLLS